jgi:hypothetical protein
MEKGKEYPYVVCGVYCGQCASGNGRVRFFAMELKRLTDVYLGWMEHVDMGFDWVEFRKGLKLISGWHCNCLDTEDCHVGNKQCAKEKGLRSCLECGEFPTCEKTEYQRSRYPFVMDGNELVQREGFEAWLEEEDRKAKEGIDMCSHLFTRGTD